MPQCPNCELGLDPLRSKEIHREAYYCGTNEAGRISVACAEVRRLKEHVAMLKLELRPRDDTYGLPLDEEDGL